MDVHELLLVNKYEYKHRHYQCMALGETGKTNLYSLGIKR